MRQKGLKGPDLSRMQAHGKREDVSGQRRRVSDVPPLIYGSLDLVDARNDHMSGVKTSAGNKVLAVHALVQFPTQLIDGANEQQQRQMLHHAIRFMNSYHGGDAVFAARLDRDERGKHSVDVFLMPRYDFVHRDGSVTKKASASKFCKAEAMKRYGSADRRKQGSALQDAWYEYMRDQMGLAVEPPKRKKAAAADRVEPEVYGLQKDRQKLRDGQRRLASDRQAFDKQIDKAVEVLDQAFVEQERATAMTEEAKRRIEAVELREKAAADALKVAQARERTAVGALAAAREVAGQRGDTSAVKVVEAQREALRASQKRRPQDQL